MPAAIARSFFAKVEPCTTARSIWLKILSKMLLRVSSAPTGTWPPDSAFASSTMSGSTFQCSTARNFPVRPMPVWISSAMNSVPYLRHSAAAPGRNSSVGRLTPLPWIGSTMKAATWRDDSACSSAARSLKGICVHPGSSGSKPARKFASSISDSAP